jgi:hypothetical protein
MADAVLPDCSSAAICRSATEPTSYGQEGSASTVVPPASVSNVVVQHNKIGGITIGALTQLEICSKLRSTHMVYIENCVKMKFKI